ncbi:hypothetical protein [Pseudofulvimonas gallinarii]|nr:hypothetical protein [Pseudofulvimonas gallinarii]
MPNNQHFQLMYQIAQLQLMEEHYDAALATVDRWLREMARPSRKPMA